MNRFRPVWGGRTPRQRVRGVERPRTVADFGECIFYLPPKASGRTPQKADLKFREGVWLGMDPRTNEVIVFGPDGIDRARTFRRKVVEEAYDKDRILKVNITPWEEQIDDRITPGGGAPRGTRSRTPGAHRSRPGGEEDAHQEVGHPVCWVHPRVPGMQGHPIRPETAGA